MSIFDNYFPLGLGTSRFPVSGVDDTKAIERNVSLVCKALDMGINYIDTSYTYSVGTAQIVLQHVFASTNRPFGVTVKVMHGYDQTSDDARRRVELQLNTMGLTKAAFFVCWSMWGYDVFGKVTKKGGIYDGAVKLKNEGIIDHICCSVHATPKDTIKIIESGAFEGITISYSILNAQLMQSVLDCALKHNVGVAVMNPLGGGLIAQNQDFFSFARSETEDNTIVSALRFVKSHPAVKIILSGISNEQELVENFKAFSSSNNESDDKRLKRVLQSAGETHGICTGCNYCNGCPKNIPISGLMQKRNRLKFNCSETYNRTDSELIKNLNLFHSYEGEWFPETAENPCVKCGACEKKCTQKLPIIDSIADTFERARRSKFSVSARKERLGELLNGKEYRKVGLYPNGGFANLIIALYAKFFGKPEFEWVQFNSNPKLWGEKSGGLVINSPDEISSIKPDVIIVCTYRYDNEIFESLRKYESDGIEIVKLHGSNDVPWVF